jgi:bile acid:Na+ symporter, BASS family
LSVIQVLDVSIPAITFLLLTAVGLFLTPADFARARRNPAVVAVGIVGPLLVLPLLALGLIAAFRPDPATETGLLLIAVCPIGGISNTYSYLARASAALSVALTGVSSLLAAVTIPLVTREFERFLGRRLGFEAPVGVLMLQLVLVLALPIGVGMAVRWRWPSFADAHRRMFQSVAFGALGMLVVFVVWAKADDFIAGLRLAVPMSAAFVIVSFALGWAAASLVRAGADDRFTLAAEFATRNVAIATAIAVTLLGKVEFAVFATTYFLTELPLMLLAIAARRWFAGGAPGP